MDRDEIGKNARVMVDAKLDHTIRLMQYVGAMVGNFEVSRIAVDWADLERIRMRILVVEPWPHFGMSRTDESNCTG